MQQDHCELGFLSSTTFLHQNLDRTTDNTRKHTDPPIKEVDFFSSSSPPNNNDTHNYMNDNSHEQQPHHDQEDQHHPYRIATDGLSSTLITDRIVSVSYVFNLNKRWGCPVIVLTLFVIIHVKDMANITFNIIQALLDYE